jgi:hypothetical protein
MAQDPNQPEQPRVEPEIIPPDRIPRPSNWQQPAWPPFRGTGAGSTHRVYVTRIGPFGIILFMLIVGVLIVVILLAAVGAFLLWIPIVVLLVAAGALLRLLRR